MIKYNLKCSSKNCRHELPFDAWFKDSNAFEIQKNSGLLTCPYCGGIDVRKNLMSPSIQTKKSFKKNNYKEETFGDNAVSTKNIKDNNTNINVNIPKANPKQIRLFILMLLGIFLVSFSFSRFLENLIF